MTASSVDYSLMTSFVLEIQTLESQIVADPSLKNIATLLTVKKYLEDRVAELKGNK
jgi:hypothetical protein